MNLIVSLIQLLIVILTAVLVGVFMVNNVPFFAVAIILLLICLIILPRKIEYGLYAVTVWVPIQYFLTIYYKILPRHFVWIDEIVVLLMFCVVFAKVFATKARLIGSPVDKYAYLFIGLALISSVVNLVNPLISLLGIRSFMQYFLLYVAIRNCNLSTKVYRNLIAIVMITFLIQVPLSIYQYFSWSPQYINAITGKYVNQFDLSLYDAVVGTFGVGAANTVGYLLTMVITVLIGVSIHMKKIRYFLIALVLLVPLVLTQSRGSYVVFVAVFFITFRGYLFHIKNMVRTLFVVIALSLTLGAAGYYYYMHSGYDFKKMSDLDSILKQQMVISSGASGRLIGIRVANDVLLENAPLPLIGVGPGMFSSTTGRQLGAKLYIETANKLRSIRCITENDIVPMLVEYGYLGLIFFILLIIALLRQNIRIYRDTKSKELKAICYGGSGAISIFLIGSLFVKIWEVQYTALYVWLYMGCLESLYFRLSKRSEVFDSAS